MLAIDTDCLMGFSPRGGTSGSFPRPKNTRVWSTTRYVLPSKRLRVFFLVWLGLKTIDPAWCGSTVHVIAEPWHEAMAK